MSRCVWNRPAAWLGGLALALASASVWAQAADAAGAPAAPASAPVTPAFRPDHWTVGAWQLEPQLVLAAGHNDNLRLQPGAMVRASPFVVALPSLTATTIDGDERTQWSWRTAWTRFVHSAEDDTANSELAGDGIVLIDAATALAWRLGWQDWHDTVSQPDPKVAAAAPDHFRVAAAGLVWRHDAEAGAQRWEAEPTLSRKRYLNHRELTVLADVDSAALTLRHLRRIEGESRAGLELRWLRSLYPNSFQSLSNTDRRALLVYQGDPAQPRSLQARVGWQQRRFDSLRPRQGLATWELEGQWTLGGGRLEFGSVRNAQDVPGEGSDAVVVLRQQLGWSHTLAAGVLASVSAGRVRQSYLNFLPRDERLRTLDLGGRIDLGRRVQLGANVSWMRRDSAPADYSFSRHLVSVSLTAAL